MMDEYIHVQPLLKTYQQQKKSICTTIQAAGSISLLFYFPIQQML